jgi:predicted O-methyltransferase YrrM
MSIRWRDILLIGGAVLFLLGLGILIWLPLGSRALPIWLTAWAALILFVQIAIYRRQQESYQEVVTLLIRQFKQIQQMSQQDYRQIEALMSMMQLLKLHRPLPPMRNWSISPELGNIIISTLLDIRPNVVVECGSGTSTLLAGYVLKDLGHGEIYSLEHDREYADASQKNLEAHELSDKARVLYAPLREVSLQGKTWLWYQNPLPEEMRPIDLLIVDGPPRNVQKMARYPAVPILYRQLSRSAIIILDDTKREDEREIVEAWLSEYGDLECEWRDTETGAAVLRRKSHSHKGGKKWP